MTALRFLRLLSGLVMLAAASLALPASAAVAPFLYRVHGPGVDHYLLGSVHLLPEDGSRWPEAINDAYEAAEAVVFEADIGALDSPQTGVALLAAAKSDKGVKGEIDAASYARLGRKLAGDSLPTTLCDTYKPWFCALTIEIAEYKRAGFSGEHGLDRQIYDAAKTDGKAVQGLETLQQQIALFTEMPAPLSREFLTAELADGDGLESPLAVYRAWKNNDVEAVAGSAADMKKRFPGVYARLLGDRNRAWLPALRRAFDGSSPQLVVVGAAHLVGPDGLVTQLRARGYKITPVLGGAPGELITDGHGGGWLIDAHAGAMRAGMAIAAP